MRNVDTMAIRNSIIRLAKLEIAALSMALLRDQLGFANKPGLLLSIEADAKAADQIAASPAARNLPEDEGHAYVEACLAARRILIETSGMFDANWYLLKNPDVGVTGVDALDHFNLYGSLELRNPGPYFDCHDYLNINTDIAAARVEPFLHYLLYGRIEGRQYKIDDHRQSTDPTEPTQSPPTPTIEPGLVRRDAAVNVPANAISSLRAELLLSIEADAKAADQLAASPVARNLPEDDGHAYVGACLAARRILIETSGMFDANWYLLKNPDVGVAGVDALDHFNLYGSLELRNPGPYFDCHDYLNINTDIAAARVEPFLHYLLYGRIEGRQYRIDDHRQSAVPTEPTESLATPTLEPSATAVCSVSPAIDSELPERDSWVDQLFDEIFRAKTQIRIAPDLMRCLPVSLLQRLMASRSVDVDNDVGDLPPFSINFAAANDRISTVGQAVMYVKLLDEGSYAMAGLIYPTYRIGRGVEMKERRRRLAQSLEKGFDVSPVFDLHRTDSSDGSADWPAVAIEPVLTPAGDRDFTQSIAARCALYHHVMQDGAGVLTCLDHFDRRFGSNISQQYKAITGFHA